MWCSHDMFIMRQDSHVGLVGRPEACCVRIILFFVSYGRNKFVAKCRLYITIH